MKYQKHYLSDKRSDKFCPLSDNSCNSNCAWFDHEEQDCRMIGSLLNIKYELMDLSDITKKGLDALFQKT